MLLAIHHERERKDMQVELVDDLLMRLEEESVTMAKAMEGSLSGRGLHFAARCCASDILTQIGPIAPAAANEAFPEKKL